MKKFTVACEVTYRQEWTGIEAETAEEAQKMVFDDGCDWDHEESLIGGPGGPEDMEVEETE